MSLNLLMDKLPLSLSNSAIHIFIILELPTMQNKNKKIDPHDGQSIETNPELAQI